jgi:uncharacterized repeat protein (TIGR02543 family)
MKLLGSGLAAAFGLLLLFASCENPNTPAQKSKPSVPSFTVSFDSDGGTEIADIKVPKGTVLNLRLKEGEEYVYVPEKPGYFFEAWYLQGDTRQKPYRTSITVNEDITLVAKWIKYCFVTLETGGEGAPGGDSKLSVLPGQLFEPGAYRPFKKGFLFQYWYLKDDPLKKKVESIRVDRDITLVVQWEEGWAVTLELDGGEYDRDYITVAKDDNATLTLALVKPVKEDYVFDGWYYDAGFNNPVPDVITVTGDITLYVKWLPLDRFASLLGVWRGGAGTYFLYPEESRLFGFYFSIDEARFFVWTDSILDGKEYSSVSATLIVGTGKDADICTRVTQKRQPAGSRTLSGTWAKGDDIKYEVWLPAPIKKDDDGRIIINIDDDEGKWVWIYVPEKGIWLYLYEDGSGYLRANGKGLDISYAVSSLSLDLLRKNVNEGALDEGEVLLRIPIDRDGLPDGFEAVKALPF